MGVLSLVRKKLETQRPGLKYTIRSLSGINCSLICLIERRNWSVTVPKNGRPMYTHSFWGPYFTLGCTKSEIERLIIWSKMYDRYALRNGMEPKEETSM